MNQILLVIYVIIKTKLHSLFYIIYKSFELDYLLKVARVLDPVHGLLGAGEKRHVGAQVLAVPIIETPDSKS